MKNITSINFRTLRNDEFCSIMNDCVQFAKNITDDEAKSIIATFEAAANDFGTFIDTSVEASLDSVASNLDAERISVYANWNAAKSSANPASRPTAWHPSTLPQRPHSATPFAKTLLTA